MQIRNFFVVAFFFLMVIPFAKSQFGIKAGVNLSSITIDPANEDLKRKTGFGFGLHYRLLLTDNLAIQPEVNYIQHGVKESYDVPILGSFESKSTMGYIQIPVLLKFSFGNMDGINYFLQAGPYLGMGIGRIKSEICQGDDCNTEDSDFGENNGTDNFDFGAHLGAGIHITKNISLDARYILGLQDVSLDDDKEVKNNGIFLTLGYTL